MKSLLTFTSAFKPGQHFIAILEQSSSREIYCYFSFFLNWISINFLEFNNSTTQICFLFFIWISGTQTFSFMFGSQLILLVQVAHSLNNLFFQIVQLKMITTINKKPDISMLTAVTVGSLCPAYTIIDYRILHGKRHTYTVLFAYMIL
jgi:hypothetical protein